MKKRTVAVVTGSRADYGHLYWLMRAIQEDSRLQLQVLVTGSHLSGQFGMTYRKIIKDDFKITAKIPILDADNSSMGITASIGRGCNLFGKLFKKNPPDVVVVLGDRYEIFAAAIAAHIAKIPLMHLHGGELTRGAIDEAIRHSITKMALFHCTATPEYRRRVIQLGETPEYVFCMGTPGLDHIYRVNFLSKKQLAEKLVLDLSKPVLLVTYHPVTLDKESPSKQIKEILAAITSSGYSAVFTKANADPEGMLINKMIAKFCHRHPQKYKLFDNLGQPLYYSCLKHLSMMIGNSSSGLVEAPSFHMPVINIGDRQRDRIKASNVMDVVCCQQDILNAIRKAVHPDFRRRLQGSKNPYDRYADGKTSWRIKEILRTVPLGEDLIKKKFFDMR